MNLNSQPNGDLMEIYKMVSVLIARLSASRLTVRVLCYIQRQVLTEIKSRGLVVVPVEIRFHLDLSGSKPAPAPASFPPLFPVSDDPFADFIAMLDFDESGDQDNEVQG